MTLTINDTTMTSDRSARTARHSPDQNGQEVSWLPSRLMDRNTATTAMTLADMADPDDLHTRQRLWPHIESWAGELDLTATDALAQAAQPPGSISAGKDPAAMADPEATGL